MERPLSVSLSPHMRDGVSTRNIMVDVIIALVPSGIAAVVLFGLSAAVLILTGVLSALVCEAMACKVRRKPLSIYDGSAVITGLLVAYNAPANAPWWVVALGSAFAILLVKQAFGGLGQNFINPAMAARAFMMASWPVHMTSFMTPVSWSGVDAIASATPLASVYGEAGAYPYSLSYMDMLLGNMPGTLGEVCKLALLAGGLYLIVRRVIDARIPLVFLGTLMLLTLVTGGDPLASVLTGGVILGGFFMMTDYVTCPITGKGRVIFALGCAVVVFCIRQWSSAYPEGMTYDILFMNVATPLIEKFTKPKVYGEVARRA